MNKYGIKEVADVTLFDVETGKPVLFFDSLKTSSIENNSESTSATGGRGNAQLVTWNYGRTATLQIQDALLSPESLALLSGNAIQKSGVNLYKREKITTTNTTATLTETPVEGTLTVYKLEDGVATEKSGVNSTQKNVTGLDANSTYIFYYQYKAPSTAKTIKFSTDAFPGVYRVVGDTLAREQKSGKDKLAQFYIPKAQLQSNFNLTMDVENVSAFDFNLTLLRDNESTDFYYITIVE